MSGVIGDNVGRASGLIAAAAAGGKVLQCLQFTDDTARSTTSTPWQINSNTLGGDITCSATSSKVLCIMNTSINNSGNDGAFTVFRDSTNLGHADYGLHYSHEVTQIESVTLIILDSPSSTSAITYQVKYGTPSSGTIVLNNAHENGRFILMEIGA